MQIKNKYIQGMILGLGEGGFDQTKCERQTKNLMQKGNS